MKFEELELVRSLKRFEEKDIQKGEVGVIVAVFTKPYEAYEVEFVNKNGTTKAIFAILPEDLEKYNFT